MIFCHRSELEWFWFRLDHDAVSRMSNKLTSSECLLSNQWSRTTEQQCSGPRQSVMFPLRSLDQLIKDENTLNDSSLDWCDWRWQRHRTEISRVTLTAVCFLRSKDSAASSDDSTHIRFFSFSLIEGYISLVMDEQTTQRWSSCALLVLSDLFQVLSSLSVAAAHLIDSSSV